LAANHFPHTTPHTDLPHTDMPHTNILNQTPHTDLPRTKIPQLADKDPSYHMQQNMMMKEAEAIQAILHPRTVVAIKVSAYCDRTLVAFVRLLLSPACCSRVLLGWASFPPPPPISSSSSCFTFSLFFLCFQGWPVIKFLTSGSSPPRTLSPAILLLSSSSSHTAMPSKARWNDKLKKQYATTDGAHGGGLS